MRNNARQGNKFEKYIKELAQINNYFVFKIPTGSKYIGKDKIVGQKTPCDFILAKNKQTYFVDTKSISSKQKMTYSKIRERPHQIEYLLELWHKGIHGGFIVNYEISDLIVFFHTKTLIRVQPNTSLKEEEGFLLDHYFTIDKLCKSVTSEPFSYSIDST